MSDPIARLRGARRTFEGGKVLALDGVTLDIARGEFVALTGPSGSGKSTLLNMLGGMDLPDGGEVEVDGIAVKDRASMERVRAEKVGFVFQMHNLIPVLSAAENIEIPLVPRGIGRRERRERAQRLLEWVGLRGRERTNIRVLSGGERQRIAIARAMVVEPPLLLADEPTGNLDSHTGADVMALLHDLRRRIGASLVLVTHNLEICRGCDRHLHMQDGRLAG